MDTLKKSSFTLAEMAIAMVISGILTLALASQFVAMARFKTALENKAEPSREAYIILNHMTHLLRFASATGGASFASDANVDLLTADIEGGHITPILTTTTCYYRRYKATNSLTFQAGTGAEQELSKYVTYFNADIVDTAGTPPDRKITLKFIFSKGDTVTPVQTKIKALGEDSSTGP